MIVVGGSHRMTRSLDTALAWCGRLSSLQFTVLFTAIAVVAANLIGSVVWYALYGASGVDVLVPLTITAHAVAIPILAFLASVIKALERSNTRLASITAELDSRVADLEASQAELKREREKLMVAMRELASARDQAEVANRSKSEFLANMSHELRTPLNAIIGFSEFMMTEKFGPIGVPRYRDYVIDINASGGHLLSLINDILDLSKVEAGKLELHEEFIDIVPVIAVCRKLIGERAAAAGLRLVFRVPADLPRLWADARAVKQIVLNLLSNAVKFTPAGGEVVVAAAADGAGGVSVSVRDSGIGMDEGNVATALTPFGQVARTITREREGTGLGLPLAKSLVEAHDGTIEIDSEIGVGTTVTVRFPAARVRAALPAREAAS